MAGIRCDTRPAKDAVGEIGWFLVMLFATSVVFYVAGPIIGSLSSLTGANLASTAFAVVCPTIAAIVVAARTNTGSRLWAPITTRPRGASFWLISIFALPAVVVVSALLAGQGSDLQKPGAAALGFVLVYLLASVVEEIGWTAFLLPRLLPLIGETVSAVLIGSVWALWHVIPFIQAGHPATWVLGQCVFTIVFRILLVRLAVGSGGSMWLAVLCHASYNLAWSLSPNAGASYDPWIAAILTAAIVTILHALPSTRPSG